MTHILVRPDGSDSFTLNAGESKTILCSFLEAPTPPNEADMIVVVDYRVGGNLLWPARKLFRFTGAYIDNWQWLPEPSGDIEGEANSAIDNLLRRSTK